LSPYLEKCCLLVSATVSYERAVRDIAVLIGMPVSRGTQQRLVQRQLFELPTAEDDVEEISIDGGKVRIRTPKGEFVDGKITKRLICMVIAVKHFCRTMSN
jgi:coenzyme F420-reducing hydrogenase beta subunit